MRCRLDAVLNTLAFGMYGLAFCLVLLFVSTLILGALDAIPFGMLGWLILVFTFHYGLPLALILGLCGAISPHAAQRFEHRLK